MQEGPARSVGVGRDDDVGEDTKGGHAVLMRVTESPPVVELVSPTASVHVATATALARTIVIALEQGDVSTAVASAEALLAFVRVLGRNPSGIADGGQVVRYGRRALGDVNLPRRSSALAA